MPEQHSRGPSQSHDSSGTQRLRQSIVCPVFFVCVAVSAAIATLLPILSPPSHQPVIYLVSRIPNLLFLALHLPSWWPASSHFTLPHQVDGTSLPSVIPSFLVRQHAPLAVLRSGNAQADHQPVLDGTVRLFQQPSDTRSSVAPRSRQRRLSSNISERHRSDHHPQHIPPTVLLQRSQLQISPGDAHMSEATGHQSRHGQLAAATPQELTMMHRSQDTRLNAAPLHARMPSKLFQHFDADADGLLSEKEVANLLKQLTRRGGRDDHQFRSNTRNTSLALNSQIALGAPLGLASFPQGVDLRDGRDQRAPGRHDIIIDGETLSVGDGDFELLFKQLSNVKHTKDPSKDPRMTLQEDIVFIKDLVIVFFAATLGGAIAMYCHQPPLIGFLLGGMTVGPGGLGIVTELVEVETLASLGISFLLFSLGIEFSLNEFRSVRRVVTVGGFSSMVAIVLCAGTLSLALGLVKTIPEATALGLAVSLSSTAVVLQCLPQEEDVDCSSGNSSNIETLGTGTICEHPMTSTGSCVSPRISVLSDRTSITVSRVNADSTPRDSHFSLDMRAKHTYASSSTPSPQRKVGKSTVINYRGSGGFCSNHSRKVMLGLLVFQDVTIGLILALLPTLQGTLVQFAEEFVSATLKLGCFVMLCLIVGEFLLPTLSEGLERARSQEVFTIGMVVFCLAMSYLSERMGLAIELGAFAAGIMLSESQLKQRVEASIEGIRGMFSAIFFVSVGMMIHWRYFYQNFPKMLALLGVVFFCKTAVLACVIYSLGRLPWHTSIACGAAIAQAGEFTFVVASKGQALMLFSASEARMINGATALSMLATPYIIRILRWWDMRSSKEIASTARSHGAETAFP